MPVETRSYYTDHLTGQTNTGEREALATIASLKNPDGSAFSLPTTATGGPGEDHIGQVGGSTKAASASFTRPSNTTPYAQYDVVAAQASGVSVIFMSFANAGRVVDGDGYIVKARLETNRTGEAGAYRLYIYRKTTLTLPTPPTNVGDNDLFTMIYANSPDRIGYIDFSTWVTGGSGSDSAIAQVADVRLSYGCASDSSTLYGLLTTTAAVTPASAQQFTCYLTFERN